jgi:hypothetical protein
MSAASSLRVPERGFTKAERAWLEEVIQAIKTNHGIAGENCTITDTGEGQLINASSCPP